MCLFICIVHASVAFRGIFPLDVCRKNNAYFIIVFIIIRKYVRLCQIASPLLKIIIHKIIRSDIEIYISPSKFSTFRINKNSHSPPLSFSHSLRIRRINIKPNINIISSNIRHNTIMNPKSFN